jgi:undecaprenyl-diphosphatase
LVDSLDWLDEEMEAIVAPLRGHLCPDAIAWLACTLGDRGFVWFLLSLARARRPGRQREVALRALLFTGAITPAVNAGLKVAVGRVRPDRNADRPLPVRIPRTSSFPSGHALAAWCAATLLSEDDPWSPAYYALATMISVSRVHVKLHHATDVVAGAFLGVVLGHLARRLLPVG